MNPRLKSKRGTFVPLFLVFVILGFAALGLSLYMGRRGENAAALQGVADATAQSAAQGHARLMNQLAFNNQAIAASIHINANVLVLSYYLGIGRVVAYGVADAAKDAAGRLTGIFNDPVQDIFNITHKVGKQYMQVAMGLSEYSRDLVDLQGATNSPLSYVSAHTSPLRALEVATLNRPSSVALTFQGNSKVPFLTEPPQGLKQEGTKETLCHATSMKAEGEAEGQMLPWLLGPLLAFEEESQAELNQIKAGLQSAESSLFSVFPLRFAVQPCGIGVTGPATALLDPGSWVDGADNFLGKAASIVELKKSDLAGDLKAMSDGNFCVRKVNEKFLNSTMTAINDPVDLRIALSLREMRKAKVCREEIVETVDSRGRRVRKKERVCEKRQITYSELKAERCVGESPESRPECFRRFEVKDYTYLCPIVSEENIVKNIASLVSGSVCREVTETFWETIVKMVSRGADGKRAMEKYCSDFKHFMERGSDKRSGYPMVNWAKQYEHFSRRTKRSQKFKFGFVGLKNAQELRDSLRFRVLVAEPQWTQREFHENRKAFCSEDVSFSFASDADQKTEFCSVAPLIGLEPPKEDLNAEPPAALLALQGGTALYEQMRAEKKIWGRMQFAMSTFEGAFVPKEAEITLSLFWPAWVALPQHTKVGTFLPQVSQPLSHVLDSLLGN